MSNNHNEEIISIPLKKLREGIIIPEPSKLGDAGADARIMSFKKIIFENNKKELIEINEDTYTLEPLERIGCPLGFSTAIPEGYYFKVVPRSGLALWNGLSIVNSPGTIDAGYRNEWMAIIVNLSNKKVTLKKGERICQIILSKMYNYKFAATDNLSESERGQGGFGSTGKN